MNVAEEGVNVVDNHGDVYGGPRVNFQRIADAINALYGTEFTALDIPILMSIIKIARLVATPNHRDSWVDMVGYALTAEKTEDLK